MTTIELTQDADEKLTALCGMWDMGEAEAVSHVIDRWHAAYIGRDGKMPDGWTLREDINQGDLESYFDYFEKEPKGGAWVERGSTLRAAIKAGWIVADKPLSDADVKALKPAQTRAAKNALDALYVRLVTDDPN